MSALRVSVIMPVLNEAARIAAQLAATCALPDLHELLVVDGQSTDCTAALVAACGKARLLHAPRGRASQMNEGARQATGDVLLFLHADVRLPRDAIAHVRAALRDPQVVAGAFKTWTVSDRGRLWPGPLLHLADLRSRVTDLPYGDQALFVRTAIFHELGGYPLLPLMEDYELSRRLRARGLVRTVDAEVRVSGRRFESGALRQGLAMRVLPLLYRLGVDPARLAKHYGDPRS